MEEVDSFSEQAPHLIFHGQLLSDYAHHEERGEPHGIDLRVLQQTHPAFLLSNLSCSRSMLISHMRSKNHFSCLCSQRLRRKQTSRNASTT
jgi:hypothetical protein